ncbi:MAG: cyclase family protein [Dehalococcoidia bacterium]|nr:cyclase family protein [Dehalococcoidia bacterium]
MVARSKGRRGIAVGMSDRTPATAEEFQAYRTRLNNWGRWGAEEQFGTLNFITPDVRRRAAALVLDGRTVSCSNPLATAAAVPDTRRNGRPADHRMNVGPAATTDYVGVSYHGFVNTHIDALCHIFAAPGGPMYNDRPISLVTKAGAGANSVDVWRDGIVTRGVLYDIPRMRGHEHVRIGEPVEGWHLEDWAKDQGITPQPGDAVLIRSGAEPFWRANPGFEMRTGPLNTPGVAVSVLEFLHDTGAALMGWDLQEASGQEQYGAAIPLHVIAIPHMGLPLLDNANFEGLSEVCAETGQYEFMLTIAPLVVIGGTGSPVNPIAMF